MPTPRINESKPAFMSRCIEQVRNEGYDQSQAVAICERYWAEKDQNRSFAKPYKP